MKADAGIEYDVFPLGAGPQAMFSMDTHKTQVNNNTLVVGVTTSAASPCPTSRKWTARRSGVTAR